MRYPGPLMDAVLLARYKRFLADLRLADGRTVTAHLANPGSMLGLARPGTPARALFTGDPARKLPWSLEAVRAGRTWVGVNTLRANRVVEEALLAGRVAPLAPYPRLRREVGWPGGRADFRLEDADGRRCWVEVKNVTLARRGHGYFPDSVTERGQRHLLALAGCAARGDRAVLLFAVTRGDVRRVGPADGIDPRYGELLRKVLDAGVEALAYRVRVLRDRLVLGERLAVDPGPHPVGRRDFPP